jgi:multiple sugar transport system permease protein
MTKRYREIGKAGWSYTLITSLVGLIYFSPVLWIILTSFKTRTDALAVPPKLFFTPTLDNFASVFYRSSITTGTSQATDMALYFFNSIFIAGTSVGLALIVGTLAAYAFSSDYTHLFDVSPIGPRWKLLGYNSALYCI